MGEKIIIQKQTGIPDDRVAETVSLLRADRRYVSHKVIPEGNGNNTIEVTLRVSNGGGGA